MRELQPYIIVCRRAAAGAIVLLIAAACGGPAVKQINRSWYIDDAPPGQPAARLYHDVNGRRVVVDTNIFSYRDYGGCIVYEAARTTGRMLFTVYADHTPAMFAEFDPLRPFHYVNGGAKRLQIREDEHDRTLVEIELFEQGDLCSAAFAQPPFREDWVSVTGLTFRKVEVVRTVVDVGSADTVGNTPLHDAASGGDDLLLDTLLQAGAAVDARNRHNITPLMYARGAEAVRLLIAAGANVNAADNGGITPLMYAARYRQADAVKLLLAAGADAAARDDLGRDALTWVPDSAKDVRELLESATATKR
jgi:hypothetical protein